MGAGAILRAACYGALLLPLLAFAGDSADAAAVLACMRANVPQTLQIKEVELRARRADGAERRLRGRLYLSRQHERLRAMLKIVAPADLAGAAYLLREQTPVDEMYMYLPALAKVRRLRGNAAESRLWGSDLSYGDLKALSNSFGGAGVTLERSAPLDGRMTQVLTLKPAGTVAPFDRLQIWSDTEQCLALRVEFFAGSTLRKRIDADPRQLHHEGRYWYAGALRIDDFQEGSQTTLTVLSVTLDRPLDERYFDPATFYLGD